MTSKQTTTKWKKIKIIISNPTTKRSYSNIFRWLFCWDYLFFDYEILLCVFLFLQCFIFGWLWNIFINCDLCLTIYHVMSLLLFLIILPSQPPLSHLQHPILLIIWDEMVSWWDEWDRWDGWLWDDKWDGWWDEMVSCEMI